MSLRDILFDEITEAHVRDLISTGVPESPVLDYKRETYGNSDNDKREFLADVSSFANTPGGDILIGIDESEGIPKSIEPLSGNMDAEIRRLESISLAGLEPRISNLRVRSVSVAGGHVIVVRIPRSFTPPHRVIAQGSNRFHARAGARKYEPNVQQLRHLFTDITDILEQVRSWHADRLVKITAGDTPTGKPRS
jgi:predicted HTH transcriptional regulator